MTRSASYTTRRDVTNVHKQSIRSLYTHVHSFTPRAVNSDRTPTGAPMYGEGKAMAMASPEGQQGTLIDDRRLKKEHPTERSLQSDFGASTSLQCFHPV